MAWNCRKPLWFFCLNTQRTCTLTDADATYTLQHARGHTPKIARLYLFSIKKIEKIFPNIFFQIQLMVNVNFRYQKWCQISRKEVNTPSVASVRWNRLRFGLSAFSFALWQNVIGTAVTRPWGRVCLSHMFGQANTLSLEKLLMSAGPILP